LNPIPSSTRASESPRAIAVVYGILCHVLFSVGVATMIMAMFFGMSRSLGQVPAPWSALVNALLLAQFSFLHSLLLSPFGATLLTRLAPAAIGSRLATTTYAIVASIQVFLLFAQWTPSGVIWWQAEGAILWLLGGLYLASWLLLLKAIWDAGIALQTGFLGWWAVANRRAPVFPPMPTTGLFRIVRQPIYVALTINRTWMASFLMVTIGENVIRLLPSGAHDPALFIRPEELVRRLEGAGFEVGRFVGLGPCGLNRRFDFIFGLVPTMAIQYLGQARATS
jgi:hypothetical protein